MNDQWKKFFAREVSVTIALPLLLVVAIGSALGAVYVADRGKYTVHLPPFSLTHSSFDFGARPALANAEYFTQVRDTFVADKTSFLEADLSSMRLRVYEAGAVVKEVPIKTKGKEGSWWETPAGLYRIESREKSHFSSFGKVYQPWSMAFQGNFFIHGWPYYPDGTPVASSYSGGCIRLADEDAKAVYDLVKVGTPILVYEKDFGKDAFRYAAGTPIVTARNYLAADLSNNFLFAERSSREVVPVASITKLVTALIASEYINLDKTITIAESMLATTSLPRLHIGEKVPAIDLLYPLLLESSNEAAEAFAQTLGPQRFVHLMNKKAAALGMLHSTFTDPAGSGAGNISTAEDLFQLAKYLQNNRSFVLKLTTGELRRTAYGPAYFKDVENFNLFAENPDFLGGKVGKTNAARETMVALFHVRFGSDIRPIIIVVLGSENIGYDVDNILRYVKANYRAEDIVPTTH